jgi:hypothetical protein
MKEMILTIIAIVVAGALCTLLPDRNTNEKEDINDDDYPLEYW